MSREVQMLTVEAGEDGSRLDRWFKRRWPHLNHIQLNKLFRSGQVRVDGARAKSDTRLTTGAQVRVPPLPDAEAKDDGDRGVSPRDEAYIRSLVLFEDEHVLAINKPAGMTVHKGAGVHSGTLVNALLHRYQTLSTVSGDERPGIVHRLDRYTSGVLLVARNDEVHRQLQEQFSNRTVEKRYIALVHGTMEGESGVINKAIRRSMIVRFKMQATEGEGRSAITEWRVRQRFANFTLLDIRIGTGRTHQIRVHLASTRHAVAGDRVYGAPAHHSGRFFLHAARISFDNPTTGERQTVEAPLPPELHAWLAELA